MTLCTKMFTLVLEQEPIPTSYVLYFDLWFYFIDFFQVPGLNNITLSGVLVPQTTTANLAAVSQLFTNYINFESSPVIAVGKSTMQPDGSQISWLSQGLQSLQLTVPFKPSAPINPIRSIQIESMALAFTPETAWTPRTDSNSVHATMRQ